MKRLLVLSASILLLLGCGASFETVARRTIATSGYALGVGDRAAAVGYTEAARRALAAAEDLEGYQASMEGWNAVERLLRVARVALETAERTVSLVEIVGRGAVIRDLREMLSKLRDVAEGFRSVGLEVPSELKQLLGGM